MIVINQYPMKENLHESIKLTCIVFEKFTEIKYLDVVLFERHKNFLQTFLLQK